MKQLSFLLLICLGSVTFMDAQVWTLAGPSSRHSHSAVFDPTTAQMIIFGGQASATDTDLNDVWLGVTSSQQSDRFTQVLPTGTLPPGRFGHVATYDPNSNRMTIFGGALGLPSPCANDAWILNDANGSGSASWFELTPNGTPPPARVYHTAVYDPTTDSMIVFGGNNCSTGYFNDVWVLSSANGEGGTPAWTQLTPSGTPPPARESASAVYDSVNNIMTLYGGDVGGSGLGDVWVLSHANGNGGTPAWTKLSPSGTPPGIRTGQTATYDPATNHMTIFGGVNNGLTLSDSWVLTSANGIGTPSWTMIKTSGTSPSVAYHSAVYDPTQNNMYVFAGSSSADKLSTNSHAFTLFGANNVTKTGSRWILGGPAVRYSAAAFYDSGTNSLFVLGGQHAKTNLDFGDYWQASNVIGSSNLKWTILSPTGSRPSPRFGHTGLFDSGSDRMMVFGGATGYPAPCVNDYHVLQHANAQGGTMTWTLLKASGTLPAVRTLHSSIYDSATNTIIIFGGYNCQATYYNDVWVLKNANDVTVLPSWTQTHTNWRRSERAGKQQRRLRFRCESSDCVRGGCGQGPVFCRRLGFVECQRYGRDSQVDADHSLESRTDAAVWPFRDLRFGQRSHDDLWRIQRGRHSERCLDSVGCERAERYGYLEPEPDRTTAALSQFAVRFDLERNDHIRRTNQHQSAESVVRHLHVD